MYQEAVHFSSVTQKELRFQAIPGQWIQYIWSGLQEDLRHYQATPMDSLTIWIFVTFGLLYEKNASQADTLGP